MWQQVVISVATSAVMVIAKEIIEEKTVHWVNKQFLQLTTILELRKGSKWLLLCRAFLCHQTQC
ncbi:hypothetical protein CSE16_02655 [Solibacillus sp. R5-41]|nr:hypothetical protein CSE16_02655 [Solibacillus sp. R5-41]